MDFIISLVVILIFVAVSMKTKMKMKSGFTRHIIIIWN